MANKLFGFETSAEASRRRREALFGKPKEKAAADEVIHGYQTELDELGGLLKRTVDPELRAAAWNMSKDKLYKELPMTIRGQSYNLAPNAPNKVFDVNGRIVKVPSNRPEMFPENGTLLNKSEMDVFRLLPPKPGYKEPQGPSELKAITAGGIGVGAPAALAYQAGMGQGDQPATQPVIDNAVQTAREVTQAPQPAPSQPTVPLRENYAIDAPYYGMDDLPVGGNVAIPGQEQRFRPQYDPGQAQRFPPMSRAMELEQPNEPRIFPTVQRAVELAKNRNAQSASTEMPSSQSAPSSDGLQSLLRGRFGEAGKGSAMEDRLTAAQEARDQSGGGMARGGTAGGGKDAALHKALEIIHHLISRG